MMRKRLPKETSRKISPDLDFKIPRKREIQKKEEEEMLTVKLYKHHTTKIIEATEVNIFPNGRAEGSDNEPKLRTNKVREISIQTYSGRQEVYYIADDDKQLADSHAGIADYWHGAYIENAHGATTETIRPY